MSNYFGKHPGYIELECDTHGKTLVLRVNDPCPGCDRERKNRVEGLVAWVNSRNPGRLIFEKTESGYQLTDTKSGECGNGSLIEILESLEDWRD
jgi:hypothetical protein